MTTPTPRLHEQAEWFTNDRGGRTLAVPLDIAMAKLNEAYSGLAAAQERIELLEACVDDEIPEGALKALGRWLAPVLDEDKWAAVEPLLNAALLQLLEAQEARQRAENERDAAIAWNHRVSVCANHAAEIVDGECVICELTRAEALAESYRKALVRERTALSIVRDRQCHEGVCTVSLSDIEKGIALLDAAIDAAIAGEKPMSDEDRIAGYHANLQEKP